MVKRLTRRASWTLRCGFGTAILFATLMVAPAASQAAELGQPAPGSTIKRLSPPKGNGIGGLEGFQGHSTAPGKAGAIPRQSARVRHSVTQGPEGAELRVITLGSPSNSLAGVPPLPRTRPVRAEDLEAVTLPSGSARPGFESASNPAKGCCAGRWKAPWSSSGYGRIGIRSWAVTIIHQMAASFRTCRRPRAPRCAPPPTASCALVSAAMAATAASSGDRPRIRVGDRLRPPCATYALGLRTRPAGAPWRGHRLCRVKRPFDRAAPALRGSDKRPRHRSPAGHDGRGDTAGCVSNSSIAGRGHALLGQTESLSQAVRGWLLRRRRSSSVTSSASRRLRTTRGVISTRSSVRRSTTSVVLNRLPSNGISDSSGRPETDSSLRSRISAAEGNGIAALHRHGALYEALLDGGRIDIGGGGLDHVANLLEHVEHDQGAGIDPRRHLEDHAGVAELDRVDAPPGASGSLTVTEDSGRDRHLVGAPTRVKPRRLVVEHRELGARKSPARR